MLLYINDEVQKSSLAHRAVLVSSDRASANFDYLNTNFRGNHKLKTTSPPAAVAQVVECPLRGREVTGWIPGRTYQSH